MLAALTVRLREAIPKTTALSIELHSDPVADTDKSGLTLELVTGSFDPDLSRYRRPAACDAAGGAAPRTMTRPSALSRS